MEWKERSPARKVTLQQLLRGTLIQDEQETYFFLPPEQKIGRCNVVAIVLGKEVQGSITTMLLDDGTGQLPLRLFEEGKLIKTLPPGEVVLVIGKVREFAKERYISPEIIRKVDARWLKIRKEELKISEQPPAAGKGFIEVEEVDLQKNKDSTGEEDRERRPQEKLIRFITDLDQGPGVLVEEILEKSSFPDAEALLKRLLETGAIFQNLPGRVKVL